MLIKNSAPEFERVVVLHNHRQKTARIAAYCQQALAGHLKLSTTTLSSVKGGREPNAELLQKELRSGDAVALVGGDGTFRDIAGVLLLPEMRSLAQNVSVTSLNQGGNACDIGTALHGRRSRPRQVFGRALQATTAYALDCTITAPGGEVKNHHAMSYIGVGKTAEAAAKINTKRYEKGPRGLRDIGIVVGALTSGLTFEILDENREPHVLGDLTFAKGPRMAKHVRFPVCHWEPDIRVTPVADSRLSALYAATGLLTGRADGHNERGPFEFTTMSPVSIHFDGEPPVAIPSYSHVAVGLADQPYTVLTTRL